MRRDPHLRPTGLSMKLFGGMAILDSSGGDYLPRSRKTRALAALLAMTAPRPIPRVQVTHLLWSRREAEQARASLRQAVHELQLRLGTPWGHIFVAERHTLSIDLRDVSVDAIAAIQPSAPRTALLNLFQGGFLEDLAGLDPAFDVWLDRERDRLGDLARVAGEALLREAQRADETIATARALLRIDRTHDAAWRALVEAHIEARDRAAARFACEQWRDAVIARPDRVPPPEMFALLARIRGDPPGRAPAAAPLDGPEVNGQRLGGAAEESSPLYGRDPESRRPDLHRPALRLGIRDMRIIGSLVDPALPEGLIEEITTALSRFRWISCVSGSSLSAIGSAADEGAVHWADHDLDLILDGTIQRGGERLRITVRLSDIRAGGAVIWSNRFDQKASDPLTVQDEVAAAVVAQLDPVLLMREGEIAASRDPRGRSARDLVLRAIPSIYRLDRISFHGAGDMLEAALRVEPGNADAMAWFAYWHLFLVGQGWAKDPDAATSRAGSLADAAVALDPNDARALTLAGHVRGFLLKRPAEAIVLHDRAIALNPNLALAWCFSGFAHSYLGDQETALARMSQAIQLSPSDPHLFFFQAATIMPHLLHGDFPEAAHAGRAAIELNPWFSSAFKGQLAALGHLGRGKEAADVLGRLLKLEPRFTVADAVKRSPLGVPHDLERYAEGLRLGGLPEGAAAQR